MAPFLPAVGTLLWSLALPSWTQLESQLPATPAPVYHNVIPEDIANSMDAKLILTRDQQAICPLCQQVWLALEVLNVNYVTVLVDSTDSQQPITGSWNSPLKVTWPDGTIQTDALEILEAINNAFNKDGGLDLYPSISKAVDSVRCNIMRLPGVFPRNVQSNPYAPYLIRQPIDGSDPIWVPEDDHRVTLEETDEVLEEYYQGPFLCGAQVTAADLVWGPFLERYAAQLPLVYEGDDLRPRSSEYESIKEWYEAMEELVPAYACRVMGDKRSWERLLQHGVAQGIVVPPRELLPSMGNSVTTNRKKMLSKTDKLWQEYAKTRPYLAATKELECVAYYVRNREQVIQQATKQLPQMSPDELDQALREVLGAILAKGDVATSLSGNARDMAAYLESQLQVPRDMGALPAATLRTLVAAAPQPRIASR